MHEYGSLPRARQDGLLVETVGEELLLYDQSSHIAHCLNPTASCVWRHCDGERDLTELAGLAGISENLVADALHELGEKDLLNAAPRLTPGTAPGISRREVIVRGVRVGAAAVPLIVSATAATPAMASSGTIGCESSTTAGDTCCLCLDVCINKVITKKECENECSKNGSKFVKFLENSKCK